MHLAGIKVVGFGGNGRKFCGELEQIWRGIGVDLVDS